MTVGECPAGALCCMQDFKQLQVHSREEFQPVEALRVVGCNNASKALADLHGLAAQISQAHPCPNQEQS